MENHSFSSLNVNSFKTSELNAFLKSNCEICSNFENLLGPVGTAAYRNMTDVSNKMMQSVNNQQSSLFTEELRQLGKERKNELSIIINISTSLLKSAEFATKSGASTLTLFLNSYHGKLSQAQDVMTGTITELITKYKSRNDLQTSAKVLNIAHNFVNLETLNLEFDKKHKSRNAEHAERPDSATKLKPEGIKAYTQLATAVEQLANLAPTAEIISLYNQMNELRKTYHSNHSEEDDSNSDPNPDPQK